MRRRSIHIKRFKRRRQEENETFKTNNDTLIEEEVGGKNTQRINIKYATSNVIKDAAESASTLVVHYATSNIIKDAAESASTLVVHYLTYNTIKDAAESASTLVHGSNYISDIGNDNQNGLNTGAEAVQVYLRLQLEGTIVDTSPADPRALFEVVRFCFELHCPSTRTILVYPIPYTSLDKQMTKKHHTNIANMPVFRARRLPPHPFSQLFHNWHSLHQTLRWGGKGLSNDSSGPGIRLTRLPSAKMAVKDKMNYKGEEHTLGGQLKLYDKKLKPPTAPFKVNDLFAYKLSVQSRGLKHAENLEAIHEVKMTKSTMACMRQSTYQKTTFIKSAIGEMSSTGHRVRATWGSHDDSLNVLSATLILMIHVCLHPDAIAKKTAKICEDKMKDLNKALPIGEINEDLSARKKYRKIQLRSALYLMLWLVLLSIPSTAGYVVLLPSQSYTVFEKNDSAAFNCSSNGSTISWSINGDSDVSKYAKRSSESEGVFTSTLYIPASATNNNTEVICKVLFGVLGTNSNNILTSNSSSLTVQGPLDAPYNFSVARSNTSFILRWGAPFSLHVKGYPDIFNYTLCTNIPIYGCKTIPSDPGCTFPRTCTSSVDFTDPSLNGTNKTIMDYGDTILFTFFATNGAGIGNRTEYNFNDRDSRRIQVSPSPTETVLVSTTTYTNNSKHDDSIDAVSIALISGALYFCFLQ